MKTPLFPETESYRRARLHRRRWYRVMTFLAAVVVFCTTYALILPAITLEAVCGLPEHTHDDSCYIIPTEEAPVCTPERLGIHRHSRDCYDAAGETVCGYADFVVHRHDARCYDAGGRLWCPLPEIEAHTHTEDCYAPGARLDAGDMDLRQHIHTDACYTLVRGELICGYDDTPEAPEPSAELTAVGSISDDAPDPIRIHVHTDDCYAWEAVLSCGYPEDAPETPEEPADEGDVLLCGKEEIILHTHDDSCYDRDGALSCGMTEVLEHQHADDCFEPVEGQPVLSCGMEEHVHTEGCYPHNEPIEPDPPEEPTEPPAEPVEPEPPIEEPEEPEVPDEPEEPEDPEEPEVPDEPDDPEDPETPDEPEEPEEPADEREARCGLPAHSHEDSCYDETGALICELEEHVHTEDCYAETDEQRLTAAVEALEAQAPLETAGEAEALLAQLDEARNAGTLSDEIHEALTARVRALLEPIYATIAESVDDDSAWMALRDSGWFEAYRDYANDDRSADAALPDAFALTEAQRDDAAPSAQQIDEPGGTNENAADGVSVSKTIAGTELENVFDITLQVRTPQKMVELVEEPDMAVVIVMDISNTMNSGFGSSTRYGAAMEAAESFLDSFAASNSLGVSKIGYVAFNTDAHQIFGLSSCTNAAEAGNLKNTMRTATGAIINQAGYKDSHSRFTNIEAGLKMGADMLAGASNEHKYIIFLSDGFPTTYISSGYSGYDPYNSTSSSSRFYDHVLNKPTTYGTSYSDEAAIRARNMANSIKASGCTVFSIGVDVGGQTIQQYITQSENANGFSVVDRTGTRYEIGDASSTEAYKNWLRNSIGSGYYYDSTDTAGLKAAYAAIFETIKQSVAVGSEADWVAADPMPTIGGVQEIEFIGLYDQSHILTGSSLTGQHTPGAENTASFDGEKQTIRWDLKSSGYQQELSGDTTIYTYRLVYRIRLTNEDGGFVERQVYDTNNTTTLTYRVIETRNNTLVVSDRKTIDFPIPAVHGYLGELTFTKQDSRGNPLAGAEFLLSHDLFNCHICRGDGTSVAIDDRSATSGADGAVTFDGIPSGHVYTLTETKAPPGYSATGNRYTVTVAYDEVTVAAADWNGQPLDWDGVIVNNAYYELPSTGGPGTILYTAGGLLLLLAAVVLGLHKHTAHRKGDSISP